MQMILNAGQSKINIRSTTLALQRMHSEAILISALGSAGRVSEANCKVQQAKPYSTFLIASQCLSRIQYQSCLHCYFLFSSYKLMMSE